MVVHEAQTPYTDSGVTAIDTLDGNLSRTVTAVSTVNEGKVGIYKVKYNAGDTAGNEAVEIVRTVHVVDRTPPEISISNMGLHGWA